MRPIRWGIVCFLIGMVGYVFLGYYVGLGMMVGAQPSPLFIGLVYLFGILFFLSIPFAIIAEVIRWVRRRRSRKPSRNI